MARLRLGLAGLLLLVLAAIGCDLGGSPVGGIDAAWSEAREGQADPSRGRTEIAASTASVSADDSDDDPGLEATAGTPAPALAAKHIAPAGRITTRRHLRPRATGPPAASIV